MCMQERRRQFRTWAFPVLVYMIIFLDAWTTGSLNDLLLRIKWWA